MNKKLDVRNLYKIFGDHPEAAMRLLREGRSKDEILASTRGTVGVRDVSFDVGEGEVFVVMGLSGSGKSTLIRMLNGLIQPTAGQILVDGEDVAACSADAIRAIRRDKIAMVFQHFALFPHKSVLDNAAYGLKIKGVPAKERRERAEAALGQVGLAAYADSYPEQLSGGMQQRVGLARGLATDPEILLMDEPFGALDPLIRRDMQDELIGLQKTLNKTIVFITHDLDEALILGDRIAIMESGRFVQVGTAEEIVADPADDYVAKFTRDIDRSRVFRAGRVACAAEAVERCADTARLALAEMERLGRNALYVVEDGRPLGVVHYRDLTMAGRNGEADWRELMLTRFPSAAEETSIHQLYPLAGQGMPIALLDGEGRLTGVIEPETIFGELTTGESPPADSPDAGAPR